MFRSTKDLVSATRFYGTLGLIGLTPGLFVTWPTSYEGLVGRANLQKGVT